MFAESSVFLRFHFPFRRHSDGGGEPFDLMASPRRVSPSRDLFDIISFIIPESCHGDADYGREKERTAGE